MKNDVCGFGSVCRRCELFKKTVRVVLFAVENAACTALARRHFAFAAICRKGGKEKIVEIGMVRHDCGDRFGKCDFVSHFHDPFVCAGPEGENGYAPTGRQCVDCRKITLLLRRIGKWGGRLKAAY